VATAGNAQASVVFNVPLSNGGATIAGYTVTSSPGGFTATGASSPIVVTGLSNGTAYTFTVVATNAAGNSSASSPSLQVTPFGCGTSTVTFTYNGASVTYGTVTGANSKCWLDRNLGATRVAQSSTDHLAYGDLFQWGRGADGHQRITWTNATTGTAVNSTTATLSTTDTPGNALFITNGASPNDWRSGQNVNLWQGVSGTNNPCPSGYRLPTDAELDAERASWSSQNATGAFASPLKLPMSGYRIYSFGSLSSVGTDGFYWSSTVSGTNSLNLYFGSSSAGMNTSYRASGFSVRCLKD
jgi:chitodextrinase